MKLDVHVTINDQGIGYLKIEIPLKKDQTLIVRQVLTLNEVLTATYGLKQILSQQNRDLLKSHMF